ncbi:transposase family protein [Streptomyces sp. NPDC048590]|uniref:transposase family protein n=1 Tax=Streptomyces sp. NPDC048590 TaxID=3365574 RepID=UPI00371CD18D
MSAVSSSPIPAVLAKLGPLNPADTSDLRIFLEAVPDPRSRRGRWYSLASILLVCAAAVVSGARTIDELAEWGARADAGLLAALGVRRHLLRWRHAPSRSAIGRVLERLDTDALDAAVGAWLAHRHSAAAPGRRRVIAVDGKALRGSARTSYAAAEWNDQGSLVRTIKNGAISAKAIGGAGTVGGLGFVNSTPRAALWRDGVVADPLSGVSDYFTLTAISNDEKTLIGSDTLTPAQYNCV